jgi:hypothetical protein
MHTLGLKVLLDCNYQQMHVLLCLWYSVGFYHDNLLTVSSVFTNRHVDDCVWGSLCFSEPLMAVQYSSKRRVWVNKQLIKEVDEIKSSFHTCAATSSIF